MQKVVCLDDSSIYWFCADTPYQALQKMLYCLNLSHKDHHAMIHIGKTGRTAFFEHNGKTYGAVIDSRK